MQHSARWTGNCSVHPDDHHCFHTNFPVSSRETFPVATSVRALGNTLCSVSFTRSWRVSSVSPSSICTDSCTSMAPASTSSCKCIIQKFLTPKWERGTRIKKTVWHSTQTVPSGKGFSVIWFQNSILLGYVLWHSVLGSQHIRAHCVLKIHTVSWYIHKRNVIYAHKKNMVLPLLTLMKTINIQQQCIQHLIQNFNQIRQ